MEDNTENLRYTFSAWKLNAPYGELKKICDETGISRARLHRFTEDGEGLSADNEKKLRLALAKRNVEMLTAPGGSDRELVLILESELRSCIGMLKTETLADRDKLEVVTRRLDEAASFQKMAKKSHARPSNSN
jgi:hypothetical protein